MALKDIALSSGSACTSASLEPSYVLRALGAAEDMAHSSLRFGMGRFTTEAEVDFVVQRIVSVVNRLREMRYAPSLRRCYWPSHSVQSVVGDGPGGYRHQHN